MGRVKDLLLIQEELEMALGGMVDVSTVDGMHEARRVLMDKVAGLEAQMADMSAKLGDIEATDEVDNEGRDETALKNALWELGEKKGYLQDLLTRLSKDLSGHAVNRRRFFKNVRYLIKENNIKIGQIEERAGVSAGYMSRLEKPGNSADPSLQFVVTVAKMLGVSIDALLFDDLTSKPESEDMVNDFILRLSDLSKKREIDWESKDLQIDIDDKKDKSYTTKLDGLDGEVVLELYQRPHDDNGTSKRMLQYYKLLLRYSDNTQDVVCDTVDCSETTTGAVEELHKSIEVSRSNLTERMKSYMNSFNRLYGEESTI